MSRGLRPVFFLLFLAFAAVSASAGPDEIFDAGVPGALQPGQREFILALEQGRYTLKDSSFIDARAADPAHPQLTKARVAELLAGAPAGGPGGDAVTDAASAAMARTRARAAKVGVPDLGFDGAAKHGGDVRGPPDSLTGGGHAAAARGELQAQFISRLTFNGDRQEREAMSAAVASILATPTGRELAAQFVKERATAEIGMKTIPNTSTKEEDGKKILSGTAGSTDTDAKPPKVRLNRVFLDTDPEYRRVALAGTLAHELFGHAFEAQRAAKAGFPHVAQFHYRGDEIGSRLIDWSIQTELVGKVLDDNPRNYLKSPESYHRDLLTADAYYVTTLSPAEMRNPVGTLRGRRKLVAAQAAATEAEIRELEAWRPVIVHFVKDHHVAKERFKPAEEEITSSLTDLYGARKTIVEVRDTLEDKIREWSTADGASDRKELIKAADSPYLRGFEDNLRRRERALRRLLADPKKGRTIASDLEMPPLVITAPRKTTGGPPIDLEELARMRDEDLKKNPGHLK